MAPVKQPRRVFGELSAVELAEQALVPRDAPRHKIWDGRRGLDPIGSRAVTSIQPICPFPPACEGILWSSGEILALTSQDSPPRARGRAVLLTLCHRVLLAPPVYLIPPMP